MGDFCLFIQLSCDAKLPYQEKIESPHINFSNTDRIPSKFHIASRYIFFFYYFGSWNCDISKPQAPILTTTFLLPALLNPTRYKLYIPSRCINLFAVIYLQQYARIITPLTAGLLQLPSPGVSPQPLTDKVTNEDTFDEGTFPPLNVYACFHRPPVCCFCFGSHEPPPPELSRLYITSIIFG